jgi:hypothetical protein
MHPAELGELEAFRDLYACAPGEVGAQARELGGALCIWLEAAPSSAMFNRALGLGLDPGDGRERRAEAPGEDHQAGDDRERDQRQHDAVLGHVWPHLSIQPTSSRMRDSFDRGRSQSSRRGRPRNRSLDQGSGIPSE